jgi:RimJ/RimL family protein N-acetyltransferase
MTMKEIMKWDVEKTGALFGELKEHLAVEAVLHGAASGRVWMDDEGTPRAGAIWVQHRMFVVGEDILALNEVVRAVTVAARERGDWGLGVYGAAGLDWEQVLNGVEWRRIEREYWEIGVGDWHQVGIEHSAGGLALRTVDAELLAEAGLGRMNQLREEMCSERVSVEDFLARSFGVCLLDEQGKSLVGWCLSEYNYGGRCEVGIEVVEEYRRRGLGTRLAQALCAKAFRRKMERVGWHCLAANKASTATARRAGLRLVRRYEGVVVLVGER